MNANIKFLTILFAVLLAFPSFQANGSVVFEGFPADGGGTKTWLGVADPDPEDPDQGLLVTGLGTTGVDDDAPDHIRSGSDTASRIGINDQWIEPGEGIRLDYVEALDLGTPETPVDRH